MGYSLVMEIKLIVKAEKETLALGEKIGRMAFPDMVIALNGNLGAGKTMLTKGIARGLDITANVNSPTFTLLKIYSGRLTLYHLDAYRITDPAADFFLEEYFEEGGVSVIEWANAISTLLPKSFLKIDIDKINNKTRTITISATDKEYFPLIEALK